MKKSKHEDSGDSHTENSSESITQGAWTGKVGMRFCQKMTHHGGSASG